MRKIPFALRVLALAVVAACDRALGPRLPQATLTLISGANQTVSLGDSLPEPVVVRLDTAGVPAPFADLVFEVVAETSPSPNHTWHVQTDAAGVASANGAITNTGVHNATITVSYAACVQIGFLKCDKYETRAVVSTNLSVTP